MIIKEKPHEEGTRRLITCTYHLENADTNHTPFSLLIWHIQAFVDVNLDRNSDQGAVTWIHWFSLETQRPSLFAPPLHPLTISWHGGRGLRRMKNARSGWAGGWGVVNKTNKNLHPVCFALRNLQNEFVTAEDVLRISMSTLSQSKLKDFSRSVSLTGEKKGESAKNLPVKLTQFCKENFQLGTFLKRGVCADETQISHTRHSQRGYVILYLNLAAWDTALLLVGMYACECVFFPTPDVHRVFHAQRMYMWARMQDWLLKRDWADSKKINKEMGQQGWVWGRVS